MALIERLKFEERSRQIRGTGRLNSRVPVAIEWTEAGQTRRVEGHTKDISTKGCLAVAPQRLAVGERVQLINCVNQNASDAFVIWRGHEGPAGWELGLELQDPPPDFWGLDF